MTDKEKVLAKFPGARAARVGVNGRWHIYTTGADGINTFGSGPTESEAWANAAKGAGMTPITDRAAFTVFEMFGRDPKTQEVWWKTDEESTLVFVETARELEEMCEELAVLLKESYEERYAAPVIKALARYQAMKEKAK